MKIISIRLKNINSLKGEHTVDFTTDPLASAGLFLITGPTGSGKSTILDAITLALYGQIPRLMHSKINNKLVEQEGIILTRHTKDCFTEVVYEVKGKRYRSSWTMSRNRNNNLNDRKQELFDIEGDCIVTERNDEVIKKNEEIIGLNYPQFVQSLILAQGKFAKLLQATRTERNALLESITGTEIYREIGKKVFDRYSKVGRLVEDQKLLMKGIELLTEDEEKECQVEIDRIEPLRDGLEKDRQAVKALIAVKETLEQLQKKRNQNDHDIASLITREDSLRDDRILLAKHDEMAVFRSEVHALDQEELTINKLKDDIVNLKKELDTLTESNNQLLIEAARLLGEPVVDFEMIERLSVFRMMIEGIQKNIADEQLKLSQVEHDINRSLDLLTREDLVISISELSDEKLHSELDLVKNAITTLNVDDLDKLKEKREGLRMSYQPASELLSHRKEYERDRFDFKQKTDQLVQTENRLKETREKRVELNSSMEKATKVMEKAQRDLDKIKAEQGLDALRNDLIPGEACPLCGSHEHPYHDAYEEKLLSTFQELTNQANRMYATINSDFILTEGIINTLNQEIESKKHLLKEMQPQLEAKQLALQESCIPFGWNLNATLGDWDKELSVMNSQIVRLEQGEKEFNKKHLLEMILVEFEKIKPLNIRIRGLQNELGAKYSGKDIAKDTLVLIDTRKENGVKREERSQRLTAAELEVSVRETNANELKENLLMRMNDKGISNLDMYRIHIMDESRVQQIRSRLNQVDSLRIALETTKKTLEKDFYEQQQMDDITKDIQSLNVEFEQLSNSVQQYSEELGKQKEKLERNKQDTLRLKDSQTLLDQLRKDQVLWGRMNELIGEKTGNRFANFVQDLTFEQLIEFGNKRLESFSDRYLLALPSAVDTGDLQVMDTYMGNTTRSIFSLSGGETFKLSLALALGLSDLAARKVKIESLFIDEGFGSLDPDSLDEAVSLLEDIQNKGNKSIGIISHVSELKDRISTKVKLIPLGSGYSKIEVE